MPTKYGPWKINDGIVPEWSEGVTHYQICWNTSSPVGRENSQPYSIKEDARWTIIGLSGDIFAYREVLPSEEKYVNVFPSRTTGRDIVYGNIHSSIALAKRETALASVPTTIYRLVPVED